MTDITDEALFDLAQRSGLFSLFSEGGYRMARAGHPLALGCIRRFAELARQEEREACARVCERHAEQHQRSESKLSTESGRIASRSAAAGANGCFQAIRSRTTRS